VKVTVTSTADIPGQCTYDATEASGLARAVNEVFDIAPNGTKELTFPAPLPTQSWRVVVACSGDFNGQNVEFGRQVQNI
jgi:ribosomal protein S10